ncbi:hypothetical protein [Falsibacillus albus]|uniref:Uncharacterized protein n=1 Tax=Falsibacillus albus TaxID=2478915 RepID=A0A3L7JWJ0_9BACI|nr:hypothetical protein [Falsibacillus albus]RLQ94479.1 hypothetical protein D9X91_13115 [Falsibacillus albus]
MSEYKEEEIEPKRKDTLASGIGLTVLLHLILIVFPVAYFFIGIVQIVYIIPAVAIAYRKGYPRRGKGLIIGAGITFLLNSACFGIVMSGSLGG